MWRADAITWVVEGKLVVSMFCKARDLRKRCTSSMISLSVLCSRFRNSSREFA